MGTSARDETRVGIGGTLIAYLLGIPVLLFLAILCVGGLTGRVRLSSCCSIADPRRDLRMRSAFEDEPGYANGAGAEPSELAEPPRQVNGN